MFKARLTLCVFLSALSLECVRGGLVELDISESVSGSRLLGGRTVGRGKSTPVLSSWSLSGYQ